MPLNHFIKCSLSALGLPRDQPAMSPNYAMKKKSEMDFFLKIKIKYIKTLNILQLDILKRRADSQSIRT